MPGANARQAGCGPRSSVVGWPSTANSRWPGPITVPGTGSQVTVPGSPAKTVKLPSYPSVPGSSSVAVIVVRMTVAVLAGMAPGEATGWAPGANTR